MGVEESHKSRLSIADSRRIKVGEGVKEPELGKIPLRPVTEVPASSQSPTTDGTDYGRPIGCGSLEGSVAPSKAQGRTADVHRVSQKMPAGDVEACPHKPQRGVTQGETAIARR